MVGNSNKAQGNDNAIYGSGNIVRGSDNVVISSHAVKGAACNKCWLLIYISFHFINHQ